MGMSAFSSACGILLLVTVFQGSAAARESAPSQIDMPTLQRLSVMKYDDAVRELESMNPEPYIRYVLALGQVWREKENPPMTRAFLNLALAVARENRLKAQEGEIEYFYALFDNSTRNLEDARKHILNAVNIFEEAHSTNWVKECLSLQANLEHRSGAYPASIATFSKLLALLSGPDDQLLKAHCIYERALLGYKMGQIDEGEEQTKVALEIFTAHKHPKGMGDCLKSLGNFASNADRKDEAMQYYQRAVEKYDEANSIHGRANCLYNIGILHCEMKRHKDSLGYFRKAIAAYTESSSVTGVGIANMEMGNAHLQMKEYDKAESCLLTAHDLLTRSRNFRRLAQTESYLGTLMAGQGRTTEAKKYYDHAVVHFEQVELKAKAEEIRALIRHLP